MWQCRDCALRHYEVIRRDYQSVLRFARSAYGWEGEEVAGRKRSTAQSAAVSALSSTRSSGLASGTDSVFAWNGARTRLISGRAWVGGVLTQLSCGKCEFSRVAEPIWSSSLSMREASACHSPPSTPLVRRVEPRTAGSNRSASVGRSRRNEPAKLGSAQTAATSPWHSTWMASSQLTATRRFQLSCQRALLSKQQEIRVGGASSDKCCMSVSSIAATRGGAGGESHRQDYACGEGKIHLPHHGSLSPAQSYYMTCRPRHEQRNWSASLGSYTKCCRDQSFDLPSSSFLRVSSHLLSFPPLPRFLPEDLAVTSSA